MLQGHRAVLIQAPTGSGKTLLTAHMLDTAARKGMGAWFIVHRRELVKQSIKAFHGEGIKYGVLASGFQEDTRAAIQIASIQSLIHRYSRLRAPQMIVWDEAHHLAAGSWTRLFSSFPMAYHIGLTATPLRLDGSGLKKYFTSLILGPSVQVLVQQGYLAPYRLFAPGGMDLKGLHSRMGDYIKSEAASAADKPTITGNAILEYKRHCAGKMAVVFCVSIEHSKHVVEQFRAAGIPSAHVDGETDVKERDAAIESFEAGRIKVLSNVELFGEGFDLPAIEVAILLRPTQSLGLYLQQVGRALRPSPGKDTAFILDHAGNVLQHGLPDQDREWSLAGAGDSHRSANAGAPVRICPKCFAAQFPGSQVCKFCGTVFEIESREVEEVEGELSEVDLERLRKQRAVEVWKAKTREEVEALARARGYKPGWVYHRMKILEARGQHG